MKILGLLCSVWFFHVHAYPHSHRKYEDSYINHYDPYHYDPYLESSRYPVAYDPYARTHVPRYDYDHYTPQLDHRSYIPPQQYETLHPDPYHNPQSWSVDYQDHVHLNSKLDDHHVRPVDEYKGNGGQYPVRDYSVHLHPTKISVKGSHDKNTYEDQDSEYLHKGVEVGKYNLYEHAPITHEGDLISEYDYPNVKSKNKDHKDWKDEYKADYGKHEIIPEKLPIKKKPEIHYHDSTKHSYEKHQELYERESKDKEESLKKPQKQLVKEDEYKTDKHVITAEKSPIEKNPDIHKHGSDFTKHSYEKDEASIYDEYEMPSVVKHQKKKKPIEKHPIPSKVESIKNPDVYEYEAPAIMKHAIKKESIENYDYDVPTATKGSDENKFITKEKHFILSKEYSSANEYEVPKHDIKEHKVHDKEKSHTMKPQVQKNKEVHEYDSPHSMQKEIKKQYEILEDEYETYATKKQEIKNKHPIKAVAHKDKTNEDYEAPIVVEKLVKHKSKEPFNDDDGFEAPAVVETLTKIKKPTGVENEYETSQIIKKISQKETHSTANKVHKQTDKDPYYKLSNQKETNKEVKGKPTNNKLKQEHPVKQEPKKQKVKEAPKKQAIYPPGDAYNKNEHAKTGHKADHLSQYNEKAKNSLLVSRENDEGYSIPIVEAMALEEHENEGQAGIHIFEFGEHGGSVTDTHDRSDIDLDPKVSIDSTDESDFQTDAADFETDVDEKLKNEELSKFEGDKESESEDNDLDELEDDDDGIFEKDEDIDEFDGSGMDLDERFKGTDAFTRSFLPVDSDAWSVINKIQAQERRKFKKCLTPQNESGNCMPIQLCTVSNIANSVDDILKNVCIIDEVFMGVCCPEFPVERVQVDWEEIENANDTFTNAVNTPSEMECGKRTSEASDEDTWPWMTTLMSSSSQKVFCGGVLIKEQYVLTAAHCTTRIPRNQILVRLRHPDSVKEQPQNMAVVEIKRHANYNPRTMQNDIALLKLPKKVKLGKFRQVICVADEETEDYVGESTSLLRWNRDAGVKGHAEVLPVILNQECQRKFSAQITDFVLCAEPRTEEIMCNADSGAPLIRQNEDGFQVIGVLTWNRKDCDGRFPSVFTRISSYHRWIENHSS